MFKEAKKGILLETALMAFSVNLCLPLMHQGQKACWCSAWTSQSLCGLNSSFWEKKKKKIKAILLKERYLVVKSGHLPLGCSLS